MKLIRKLATCAMHSNMIMWVSESGNDDTEINTQWRNMENGFAKTQQKCWTRVTFSRILCPCSIIYIANLIFVCCVLAKLFFMIHSFILICVTSFSLSHTHMIQMIWNIEHVYRFGIKCDAFESHFATFWHVRVLFAHVTTHSKYELRGRTKYWNRMRLMTWYDIVWIVKFGTLVL